MDHSVLIAFGLTLFAGLSTGIGSAIAFFSKRTNTSMLSLSLGLSAGVMIYISFVELYASSLANMADIYGKSMGHLYALLSFFGGILLIMVIDLLVPERDNPHEIVEVEMMNQPHKPTPLSTSALARTGLISAVVIAIHNFPEGMVTFLTALEEPALGLPIAIAIAIHNIPEGISVSVPIYYATGNRAKAFWISFSSGLAEPLGALFGYLLLRPYLTPSLFGVLNAMIAGIMVYISLDELLPAAEKYGKHHLAIIGVIAGMLIMALTLVIL